MLWQSETQREPQTAPVIKTTHEGETSPEREVENDNCRLTGHFRGSTANKGKPAEDKAKTRGGRVNQIDEESSRVDKMRWIPRLPSGSRNSTR